MDLRVPLQVVTRSMRLTRERRRWRKMESVDVSTYAGCTSWDSCLGALTLQLAHRQCLGIRGLTSNMSLQSTQSIPCNHLQGEYDAIAIRYPSTIHLLCIHCEDATVLAVSDVSIQPSDKGFRKSTTKQHFNLISISGIPQLVALGFSEWVRMPNLYEDHPSPSDKGKP